MEQPKIIEIKRSKLAKPMLFGSILTGAIHSTLDAYNVPLHEHLDTALTYGPAVACGITVGIRGIINSEKITSIIPEEYQLHGISEDLALGTGGIFSTALFGTAYYLMTELGYLAGTLGVETTRYFQ